MNGYYGGSLSRGAADSSTALSLGTSDADIVSRLGSMDRSRLRGYKSNLSVFEGQQWLEPTVRRNDRRLTLNYVRALIEKVSTYLLTDRRLVVDLRDESDEAKSIASQTENALAVVSRDNQLEGLDFDTEIDAAILGDGCYKVTWDVGLSRVRVRAPDVQGIYVWWEADDLSQVWRVAERSWLSAESVLRRYSYAVSGKGAWVCELWTESSFSVWIDKQPLVRTVNPYGFIPYVIFANVRKPKEFWGRSDIDAIIEPQRELNRAFTQISRILELSGNPILVLENVDKAEDVSVSPGQVFDLPEKAKAYLLDLLAGGGVGLHTQYVDLVYRSLHDLSESPRTAFGQGSNVQSGVGLEIELQPLIQKVTRKRAIREPVYRKRAEYVLRLLDQWTGTSYMPALVRVEWGTVTPKDRSRLIDDERLSVASGVSSRRTSMGHLGVADPDREYGRWLEEEVDVAELSSTGKSPVSPISSGLSGQQSQRRSNA